jgi:Base plate wedge protein 53
MSFYFRSVPNFEYVNPTSDASISDYVQIKNLFKKSKIREDIFHSLVYFTKYNIVGNERPDQIAEKYYDDPTLDWVILLSNNIIDVRSEWPLDNESFDKAMLEKYGSYEDLYGGIHHYETKEIKNSLGVTLLPAGIKLSNQWKTNGNFIEVNTKKISQIFSGNGVTPSTTVNVTLFDGIQGLKVGDEVIISNISEDVFNGNFKVTSVNIPFNDNITRSFTYELTTTPGVALPVMSSNQAEEMSTVIYDGSISGNTYYFEYYDQGLMNRLSRTEVLTEVTNYDYELNLNNKKREIYVLKPTYLGIILNDAEAASSYKIGGVQFVNDTLKRGDNIKIYS